jgi:hypothetical protein
MMKRNALRRDFITEPFDEESLDCTRRRRADGDIQQR